MGIFDAIQGLFGSAKQSEEELAMIQAIVDSPDDDAVRLAYADWLVERGNPYGEFLRVDCELSAMNETDPGYNALDERYGELMSKYGKKWVKPLKELELQPIAFNQFFPSIWFERGMIENMTIDKRGAIPGKAERLFELAPLVRHLTFERCSPDFSGIANCQLMRRIASLDLSADLRMTAADARKLLSSKNFANLTKLDLSSKDFGDDIVDALVASSLSKLSSLDLSSCSLSTDAVQKLAAWQGLAGLEALRLRYNDLSAEAVAAIVGSPQSANLQLLDLGSNDFGAIDSQTLANAQFSKLQVLRLESNQLEATGLSVWLDATGSCVLTELDLNYNRLGDEGVKRLAASPQLASVVKLSIASNDFGSEAADALLNSPHLGNLLELEISHNEIGPAGAQLLLDSPKLKDASKLQAYGLELGSEWEAKLLERFGEEVVSLQLLSVSGGGF